MAALPSHLMFHVALLLNRIAVGAYILLAGVAKLRMGMEAFLKDYETYQPAWLPDLIATPYGYALPFVEIVLGALLIVGLFTRISAIATLLLLLSITIATTIKVGSLSVMGEPFNTNLIFMAIVLLIAVTGAGRLSVDALWRDKKSLHREV